MLETTKLWWVIAMPLVVVACAAPEPTATQAPLAPPVRLPQPPRDDASLAAEAAALLAQAETDVQRARAKRALWLGAWQGLLAARKATAAADHAGTIHHAKHASELAQLGLEQLAYPAVK
jgi:hypothetical protein